MIHDQSKSDGLHRSLFWAQTYLWLGTVLEKYGLEPQSMASIRIYLYHK